MKKKIILLSIIIFPSLIYFFFELTQANFKKMPYLGPKTVMGKGDTAYWSVPSVPFATNLRMQYKQQTDPEGNTIVTSMWQEDSVIIDTANYPVYVFLYVDPTLRTEGYKLAGIYDYMKFKQKDLKDVPIFIAGNFSDAFPEHKDGSPVNAEMKLGGVFDSLQIKLANFRPVLVKNKDRTKFLTETYFKGKPIHVFDYFMVLVDKKRHIRGYYDPSYNAEVKRMIDEYKHLKIRDEYAETLKQNDIKQNDKK